MLIFLLIVGDEQERNKHNSTLSCPDKSGVFCYAHSLTQQHSEFDLLSRRRSLVSEQPAQSKGSLSGRGPNDYLITD